MAPDTPADAAAEPFQRLELFLAQTDLMEIFWFLLLCFVATFVFGRLYIVMIQPAYANAREILRARRDGYGFVRVVGKMLVVVPWLLFSAAVISLILGMVYNR